MKGGLQRKGQRSAYAEPQPFFSAGSCARPYSGHTGMALLGPQSRKHPLDVKQQLPLQPAVRLGEREREVLEVLWSEGSATVQQVAECLRTTLAYTTVMTTLDRLFKKKILLREKRERAFVYRPAVSRGELERDRAAAMVQGFFSGSDMNRDALVSYLVDAVQSYDRDLLRRLEEKVRLAKRQDAMNANPQKGGTI
jgi:predicted transcriptional regulator